MTCAVGDTLIEGAAHLHVHGSGTPLPEDALRRAVHLERERTFEQDPKYPIRLLVDIAIKALSPAINDPTTASRPSISSRISSAVSAWLNWTPATSLTRTGLSGWSSRPRREDYLTLAFDEIRHFGSSSVQVMRRMTSALVGLAASLPSQGSRRCDDMSSTSTVTLKPRRSTPMTRGWHVKKTGRESGCLGGIRTRAEQPDRGPTRPIARTSRDAEPLTKRVLNPRIRRGYDRFRSP